MLNQPIICPKCGTTLIDDDYDEMILYNHETLSQEGYFCHNCESYVKAEYKLTLQEVWIEL